MDGALPILPNQISQSVASLNSRDLDEDMFRTAFKANALEFGIRKQKFKTSLRTDITAG